MSNADASSPAPPEATQAGETQGQTSTVEKTKTNPRAKNLPPYNVILLNDDDHTVDYVVQMLRRLFGHPEERGQQLAQEVDKQGRAILLTTHREHAELKRDQVLAFGADPRIPACRGSMSAVIEPAEGD